MATSTYTPLYTTTISGTSTSSVSITIPAGYTDLRIVFNGSNTVGGTYALFGQLNSDTGSNYSSTRLTGNGSAASSSRTSSQNYLFFGWTSSGTQGTITVDLMNYSNATTYKTTISRGNDTAGNLGAFVNLWRNTAAITSLTLISESASNFSNGSTFSLYGISAAPSAKATGGMITSDATYYYHTFTSTGTFTPTASLSADILVVAGGGGGGYFGGGGGAGGLLGYTSQSLTATGYTCTIGSGGTGAITNATGASGTYSQFGSLTQSAGGGGGGNGGATPSGLSGGSGGGSSYNASAPSTVSGGSASPSGQGNAGGAGSTDGATYGSNGGGGGANAAGAAGATTSTNYGGAGGAGSSTYSSWGSATSTGQNVSSTYYYAGGGGGGSNANYNAAGGNGGGGAGAKNAAGVGTAGTVNTGGGGGGGGYSGGGTGGGNGGSGLIIVRYAK